MIKKEANFIIILVLVLIVAVVIKFIGVYNKTTRESFKDLEEKISKYPLKTMFPPWNQQLCSIRCLTYFQLLYIKTHNKRWLPI